MKLLRVGNPVSVVVVAQPPAVEVIVGYSQIDGCQSVREEEAVAVEVHWLQVGHGGPNSEVCRLVF